MVFKWKFVPFLAQNFIPSVNLRRIVTKPFFFAVFKLPGELESMLAVLRYRRGEHHGTDLF